MTLAAALSDNPELLTYLYILKINPNVQVIYLPQNMPFLFSLPSTVPITNTLPLATPTPQPTPTPTAAP